MVMRIQKIDSGFGIVLSEEIMQSLHLQEGTEVELLPVAAAGEPVIRYATRVEVIESYARTLPRFRADYEELAK